MQALRGLLRRRSRRGAVPANSESTSAPQSSGCWDAEAAACGYTEAQEREAAAGRRAEDLLRTAAAMPARSLAGVIAKLAVAAEWALSEPEADGHPWSFLATALAGLTAIVNDLAPDHGA